MTHIKEAKSSESYGKWVWDDAIGCAMLDRATGKSKEGPNGATKPAKEMSIHQRRGSGNDPK